MTYEGENRNVDNVHNVYVQMNFIPGYCTFPECGMVKDKHINLSHDFEQNEEGMFDIRNLTIKQRKIVSGVLIFLTLVFLGCTTFLIYDHVKYPGKSETPDKIVLWRNICAIASFASSLLICVFIGVYLYYAYRYETGVCAMVTVVTATLLYFASAGFWLGYHLYYTNGNHHVPKSVHTTKMVAMIYTIVVTVGLLMIACAQDPTVCLIICLMDG